MQTFHNDPKLKEQALAELRAQSISKDGIEYADYETRLGIPKEVGQWEDIIFEELPPENAAEFPALFLESVPVGADLSRVHAKLIVWLFENRVYGLRNMRSVRRDPELLGFCEAFTKLYAREASGGEPVAPEELRELHMRASEAWLISGDRMKFALTERARRWAWLGARKWAWIAARGWSGAWKWLLAGTRGRNRAVVFGMVHAWTDAWKWKHPYESRAARIVALRNFFLKASK